MGRRHRAYVTSSLALALAVVGVLQWWHAQLPLLAVVGAWVALSGLLSRWLPLGVSLAGGFLGQTCCYAGLLVLAPILDPGTGLRPAVALGILLLPGLAAVADLVLALQEPTERAEPAEPAEPVEPRDDVGWSALVLLAGPTVLIVTLVLAHHDHPLGDVAWATYGDARNHLAWARGILADGGLHGFWLANGPYFADGDLGLLIDTHGRGSLGPQPLLAQDLTFVARFAALLVCAWSMACGALVCAFGRPARGAAVPVLVAASLLPLTGLGLGVLTHGGFISVLVAAPLLLTTLAVSTWAWTNRPSGAAATACLLLLSAAPATAGLTWTPFALVAGVAAAPALLADLRRSHGATRAVHAVVVLLGAVAAAAVALATTERSHSVAVLIGEIFAPTPVVCASVPVLVVLFAVTRIVPVPARAYVPYLVGTGAALLIDLALVIDQPAGEPWNYYPAKFAWLWLLTGLPLLLLPFAHRTTARAAAATIGSLVVLLGATAGSTVTSPILPTSAQWLAGGQTPGGQTPGGQTPGATISTWPSPSAAALARVLALGRDDRHRYVIYDVDPASDRLANFWLAMLDPDYQVLAAWAYGPQSTPADLCPLLAKEPDRVVVTSDATLRGQLQQACGQHHVATKVVARPVQNSSAVAGSSMIPAMSER